MALMMMKKSLLDRDCQCGCRTWELKDSETARLQFQMTPSWPRLEEMLPSHRCRRTDGYQSLDSLLVLSRDNAVIGCNMHEQAVIGWNTLEYTRVEWNVREYAGICRNGLEQAGILCYRLEQTQISWNRLKWAGIDWNRLQTAVIGWNRLEQVVKK